MLFNALFHWENALEQRYRFTKVLRAAVTKCKKRYNHVNMGYRNNFWLEIQILLW